MTVIDTIVPESKVRSETADSFWDHYLYSSDSEDDKHKAVKPRQRRFAEFYEKGLCFPIELSSETWGESVKLESEKLNLNETQAG